MEHRTNAHFAAAPAGSASNWDLRAAMTGDSGLISMMRRPFMYSIARESAIVCVNATNRHNLALMPYCVLSDTPFNARSELSTSSISLH